jgi:transcription elongation factor GreA
MFRQAIERLEKELRQLEREYRHDLPKEIKKALAMGDLRENAEYHAALERQSFVKAKIGHIKKRLLEISMIRVEALPKDRVGLGSSVVLYDLKEEKEIRYELVFSEDADVVRGYISITSPIGKGLAGRREGDEVTIQVPSGVKRFEIVSLQTVHQKENPTLQSRDEEE